MGMKQYIKKHIPTAAMEAYMRFLQRSRISTSNIVDLKERKKFFAQRKSMGLDSIPIFLVSFNRLSYLRTTVKRLEDMGKTNLIIIDNASTYPPLLEYYKQIPYKVIYMDQNYGHKVFWENDMFQEYRKDFYILSDPDVIPAAHCPQDFVEKMFCTLEKYPNIRKVGFSLKIDDFPSNGAFGPSVINWEKQFHKYKIRRDNVYLAALDTTFALYVPDQYINEKTSFYTAMRTGYPYEAQHLPWYRIMGDITEEDEYYTKTTVLRGWDVSNHKTSQ